MRKRSNGDENPVPMPDKKIKPDRRYVVSLEEGVFDKDYEKAERLVIETFLAFGECCSSRGEKPFFNYDPSQLFRFFKDMTSKYPQLFKGIIFEHTNFSDPFDLAIGDLEMDGHIIQGPAEVTENGRVYKLSLEEAMVSNTFLDNHRNTGSKTEFLLMGKDFYDVFKIVKNPEESGL